MWLSCCRVSYRVQTSMNNFLNVYALKQCGRVQNNVNNLLKCVLIKTVFPIIVGCLWVLQPHCFPVLCVMLTFVALGYWRRLMRNVVKATYRLHLTVKTVHQHPGHRADGHSWNCTALWMCRRTTLRRRSETRLLQSQVHSTMSQSRHCTRLRWQVRIPGSRSEICILILDVYCFYFISDCLLLLKYVH